MTIMQESFKYDNIVIYHGKSRGSMCNSAADLPYIVRGSEMGVNYLVLALICRGEDMHRDTGRRVPSKTQCCSCCTTCSCSWMDGWISAACLSSLSCSMSPELDCNTAQSALWYLGWTCLTTPQLYKGHLNTHANPFTESITTPSAFHTNCPLNKINLK